MDYVMSNGKSTASEDKTLFRDKNGEPESWMFNYRSVVEILLYLHGHTRPYVALDVNSCSRNMFSPKISH